MSEALSILLIDDNPDDRLLVAREIRKVLPDAHVDEIGEASGLEAFLAAGRWPDVVVTDYQLRWSNGLDVFRLLQARNPDVPVIMFTDSGNEEVAVQALKEGVVDYITKTPRHYSRVPYAIRTVAEHRRHRGASQRSAAALERSESLLRLALQAASMAVWEYEPRERRFVLHAQPEGSVDDRRIGFEELEQAVHRDDVAGLREALEAALARGERLDREFRLFEAGELKWIRAAGTRAADGRVVGVMDDVTLRKRLLQELQDADRRKDQFIATLGHELRNPLAPIGYALRLLQDAPDAGTVARAAQVIERQVGAMGSLLDQLLDLSRITHGLVQLDCVPVDLSVLVRQACDDAGPMAAAVQQRVECDAPAVPVRVQGDPLRLKQVVDNLLHNASKFGAPRQAIRVSLRREGGEAVLAVRDQGIGIPSDMLQRIFEPLVQVQAGPSARTRGGLGIGLAMVRSLVQLHGGRVSASSEGADRGAVFEVRLPLFAEEDAPADVAEAAGHPHTRGLRVLVADDQPDAAETLGQVLELMGYEVRTAFDGAQAQAVGEQWRPDVMVLDIGMPSMSGDEVARWVRAQPWGSAVRLIALTGWGRDEDRQRFAAAGFEAHLVKPAMVEDLVRALAPG
jgi:two-component system CheB/CheR fusion protein